MLAAYQYISLLLHDHGRAYRHPPVEVDDIFVGEPEAA
jgi:hypothetical protein